MEQLEILTIMFVAGIICGMGVRNKLITKIINKMSKEIIKVVEKHGRRLKQQIGLALSELEATELINSAVNEALYIQRVSQQSVLLFDFYKEIDPKS